MDEKAVRTTLREFYFFTDEPGCSKVVCFTDVTSYQSNGTKIGKRILMMK